MQTEVDGSPVAAVAVVASAGGVEALSGFVRALPADFPAVVLVVLHISETGPSVLPRVLARESALPVAHASGHEALAPGRILVAPPGRHLRVHDDLADLDSEPRENGHRPSADALLRSVAESWGRRAAGIVLSGTMDDGAAGLRAIAANHGLTIVQDPAEAAFPGMPRAAIAEAHPAVVCQVHEMATHLEQWIATLDGAPAPSPAAATGPSGAPQDRDIAPEELSGTREPIDDTLPPSEFTCPDCGGTLWAVAAYGTDGYRCRVGHRFTLEAVLRGKQDAVEAALWAGIVALEERVAIIGRVAGRLARAGGSTRRCERDIETTTEWIDALRALVREFEREDVISLVDGQKDVYEDVDVDGAAHAR
ncbi:MAG: chemotaxis protein CheB [Acidimicrobiales bacterium]